MKKNEDGNKRFITTNECETTSGSLKNNIAAVFHRVSNKHIHRYLYEVSGRKSRRELDTAKQMGEHACNMVGKLLRFQDLIAKTPAEIAELEANKAEEAAMEAEQSKRRELVDGEYDFFKRIYPDIDGMPPLPMVKIKNPNRQ